MKNRFTLSLLILVSTTFAFGQNLVAEYQLNRNLKDNTSNANSLTIFSSGNGVLYVDGRSTSTTDSAVKFDEGQGLVCTKPIDNRAWSGAAISLWVRNIEDGQIFEGAYWGSSIFINADGNVGCFFKDNLTDATIATGTNFKDGVWHHIVAQNTDAVTELYVDGVKKSTFNENFTRSAMGDTKAKIYLGTTFLETNKLAGEIDNIQVYDDDLSQAHIDSLYAVRNAVSTQPVVMNTEVTVYPNPASNVISFKNLSPEISAVEVFSVEGKLVSSGKMENTSYSIEELTSGQYYVALKNKLGVAIAHSKFLKN